MSDFIQRFHFLESPVRGEMAQLDESYQAVLERHDYPARVQALLGELMTASVLLAATLKFEGSLILQARGQGVLSALMAECNDAGQVRAIAQMDEPWSAALDSQPLEALFPNGQLAITIEPQQGERYQGIVPLQGQSLAHCLEHYFDQSEQLPTRLWLAADEGQAGGLLLQILPGAQDADQADSDIWPRLQQLAGTVKAEELTLLPATELLYRLFHEENVELLQEDAVSFHCNCSRERTEQALISLGEAELRDIVAEQGRIQVSCQFCHQEYAFDPIDVEQLIRGGSGQTSQLH